MGAVRLRRRARRSPRSRRSSPPTRGARLARARRHRRRGRGARRRERRAHARRATGWCASPPGGAFWVLLVCLALLATDAITRLQPAARAAGAAARRLPRGGRCWRWHSGAFDHLSIMREYAVNAERFARELRAARVRSPSARSAPRCSRACRSACSATACRACARGILGTLNVIQTIPAIALFGILMAPLGALAAAMPLAARFGIRGIGAAPAVVALFLVLAAADRRQHGRGPEARVARARWRRRAAWA